MDSLELTSAERKKLRGQAMGLKPALIIGKSGLTLSVLEALDAALSRDGLIKIRLEAPDRDTRSAWLVEIAHSTNCTICGTVGHTASLYRKSKD